jgi:hypothetical protein
MSFYNPTKVDVLDRFPETPHRMVAEYDDSLLIEQSFRDVASAFPFAEIRVISDFPNTQIFTHEE